MNFSNRINSILEGIEPQTGGWVKKVANGWQVLGQPKIYPTWALAAMDALNRNYIPHVLKADVKSAVAKFKLNFAKDRHSRQLEDSELVNGTWAVIGDGSGESPFPGAGTLTGQVKERAGVKWAQIESFFASRPNEQGIYKTLYSWVPIHNLFVFENVVTEDVPLANLIQGRNVLNSFLDKNGFEDSGIEAYPLSRRITKRKDTSYGIILYEVSAYGGILYFSPKNKRINPKYVEISLPISGFYLTHAQFAVDHVDELWKFLGQYEGKIQLARMSFTMNWLAVYFTVMGGGEATLDNTTDVFEGPKKQHEAVINFSKLDDPEHYRIFAADIEEGIKKG